MSTITTLKAANIASAWHDGQWSALYSLASTKQYFPHLALQYRYEVLMSLDNVYHSPTASSLSVKDQKQLESLLTWFKAQEAKNEIATTDVKHIFYGFRYPKLVNFPAGLEIEPIRLPN